MDGSIPAAGKKLLGVVWVVHNTEHLQIIFRYISPLLFIAVTFQTLSVWPSVRFGFFDLVNIDATLIFLYEMMFGKGCYEVCFT